MNIIDLLDHPQTKHLVAARLLDLQLTLASARLWEVQFLSGAKLLLESRTGTDCLLWDTIALNADSLQSARAAVAKVKPTAAGESWRLPTPDELMSFAKVPNNPLRAGSNNRLADRCYVFADTTMCDLDHDTVDQMQVADRPGVYYTVVKLSLEDPAMLDIFQAALKHVVPAKKTGAQDIWQPFKASLSPSQWLPELDWRVMRLPRLDPSDYSDKNKGIWEFWGADDHMLESSGIVARNPVRDIRDRNIAIDFGTSSTVVAYEENGTKKLLRVGVQDYLEEPKAAHFENPTVLQFNDLPGLFAAWNDTAYRPAVNWADVCTSHEALEHFRSNETDPAVVASILPKIKQWAMRQSADHRTRIADNPLRGASKAMEYELSPLSLNAPVKGEALTVHHADPLDPVELYAWFLGMIINWRKFGLHLRYYMTFPVEYPRDVRDKILSSFKRGLQRSLPAPLVGMPEFDQFMVDERASEPAAYAACALKALGIAPSAAGLAYAVFDFGGGTTDFDFGYYRQPDADEEDAGYEEVFEHFSAAGDKFLGGENLLENMAYRVFQANLDHCRTLRIVFTRPLDAQDFPGWEPFLDQSQAAHTNTLMLMSQLRPIWEGGAFDNSSGVLNIQLLNKDGVKVSCSLILRDEDLLAYLQERIGAGIYNFCVAMRKAFGTDVPETVHVLLAGNASRSKWVLAHFGLLEGEDACESQTLNDLLLLQTEEWLDQLFGNRAPSLCPCRPLAARDDAPYEPTAKTGVALGLLELCPGGVVKVVNRSMPGVAGEAAFGHYVGRIRQGLFMPGLHHGAPYRQWFELGPQREKVFELRHTDSPEAHTGKMGKDAVTLMSRRIDLSGAIDGHRMYARAITPHGIEICTAVSLDAANAGEIGNLQTLNLQR